MKAEKRENKLMWGKIRKVHLVGIGGIGMSGIAEVLLNLGFKVSGSDLKRTEITLRLEELGGKIFYGHNEDNIGDAEVVVISSAVREDNSEVLEARRRKVPVIQRAEMLAELMRLKQGIAIAGSHGKTTTTSMVATVLEYAGLDPTAVIGGKLDRFGSNARLGESEFMVVEADESDGSFLKLNPVIALITNIDREHLDHYGSFESLRDCFKDFANRVPFYGLSILCIDCPAVRGIVGEMERRYLTYGESPDADLRAIEIEPEALGCSFTVISRGKQLGRITLGQPGRHNAINALGAVGVGLELGLDFAQIREALNGFHGVGRRFQVRGVIRGVVVVDDYGHHPREIEATLRACREWSFSKEKRVHSKRIICIFQPHRYTRTKELLKDFASCFDLADELVLTEIYSAGEDPIAGISGKKLFEVVAEHRKKRGFGTLFIENLEDIPERVFPMIEEGDMVLTMGAGNIWQVGLTIVELLNKKERSDAQA